MKKILKGGGIYIFLVLAILLIYWLLWDNTESKENWPISKTIVEIERGNIEEITIRNNTVISGKTKNNMQFDSYVPLFLRNEIGKTLYQKSSSNQIKLIGEKPQESSILADILPMIITIIIFAVIWFVFMNNSAGGGGKAMSFGKSKAKLHKADQGKKIFFKDVAGLKEEKEELYEIVDFLKTPKKYNTLGARIPKGVLMVGRPGTGKTYLSRAVAGEAGVPFFSISGSDFVEMFVGVGASRVRDMFETAKKNSPCIIFIDEIDAVGRKRGAGLGGGHDEREQTLNQLLVEMDGFSDNQGIIIMAATNRPDILDPALLRAGRFDRQIMVGLPDIEEREEILKIHSRNKPVAEHVNFRVIARGTPGFTPADLENVLNEAAILAARKNESQITEETIEEATTKLIAGVEKKSKVISEKERKLTAFHEGGHAVVGRVLSPEDPIHQVTIIPRGMAGGFTLQLPSDERYYKSKTEMENEICVLLGGRMGEKLVMGDISTGASNDLEKVTSVARSMVTKYGMAEELSVMSYASDDDDVFLGRSLGHTKQNSEQVQAEIDRAVRRIVDTAYQKTEQILTDNMDALERVAEALLEFETIYNDEFEAAFNHGIEKVREVREQNKNKNNKSMADFKERKAKEKAELEKAEAEKSDAEIISQAVTRVEEETVAEGEKIEKNEDIKREEKLEEAIEESNSANDGTTEN